MKFQMGIQSPPPPPPPQKVILRQIPRLKMLLRQYMMLRHEMILRHPRRQSPHPRSVMPPQSRHQCKQPRLPREELAAAAATEAAEAANGPAVAATLDALACAPLKTMQAAAPLPS